MEKEADSMVKDRRDQTADSSEPCQAALEDSEMFHVVGENQKAESTESSSSQNEKAGRIGHLSHHAFEEFASEHFQGGATSTYTRTKLKHSLLPLSNESDQQSALAVWTTILRFMGDLPMPLHGDTFFAQGSMPVMTRIYTSLGCKHKSRRPEKERVTSSSELDDKELPKPGHKATKKGYKKWWTLKKSSKIAKAIADKCKEEEYTETDDVPLEDCLMSDLEKLHFIIGHGILHPELRDEIYCMILKQLTQNPRSDSQDRGWMLLICTTGCYAPSEKFLTILECFIKESSHSSASCCAESLKRTLTNGDRLQPPSLLELQTVERNEPMLLPITLMTGEITTVIADAASTAQEICQQLAEKIGLTDQFGFSLFLMLFSKVSSLGSGSDNVMDAISQCEQITVKPHDSQHQAVWRLYFRKEIFSPWYDPGEDNVATNMIYLQVVKGIKFGEYQCDKDEDLAMIAAQQYFIDHGTNLESERLKSLLTSYMPVLTLQANPGSWMAKVTQALTKPYFASDKLTALKVKEDIVNYSKFKWPMLFSKFFEAQQSAGPCISTGPVILAVNWTGVYALDDQEELLLPLSFRKITAISRSRVGKIHGQSISLATLHSDEFTFTSAHAEKIYDLALTFMDGLRMRSKYVIALQNHQESNDNSGCLSFEKGDLIILGKEFEEFAAMGECYGECFRSGASGNFPAECVHVLPTLARPSPEFVKSFKESLYRTEKAISSTSPAQAALESGHLKKPHTLQDYSHQHFRLPEKRTLSKSFSSMLSLGQWHDELWRHTTEPLTQPLLQKLQGRKLLSKEACLCFRSILRYMEDHLSKCASSGRDLTDLILESPIKHELLRDEVYCQIIKQLTNNKNRMSDERGWQLMWLCTGCFVPCANLIKEVTLFLRSHSANHIATDSLKRLQTTLRQGARKYPPHPVEVATIQLQVTQIMHDVYFPDGSIEAFEVHSSTSIKELCQNVANNLKLKAAEDFGLYVQVADKDWNLPEKDNFFDCLRYRTGGVMTPSPLNEGTNQNMTYHVIFKRILWTEVVPGEDVTADTLFHYHQALPSFLRGHYKCSQEEAINLAALIFRVKHGDDADGISGIANTLGELIPNTLVTSHSPEHWQKSICAAYSNNTGMTQSEAKIAFLKSICGWPLFGSAFFEVKQASEAAFPEAILLAINKQGVSLIHGETKEMLITHPFHRISSWSCQTNSLRMSIGAKLEGTNLVFETAVGDAIDDLLTSLISWKITFTKF